MVFAKDSMGHMLGEELGARARRELSHTEKAAIAWQDDDGTCHFCGFYAELDENGNFDGTPHNEDCPLVQDGFVTRDGKRTEKGR